MNTDCNECLKFSKKVCIFNHYRTLPQQDLPEIKRKEEISKGFYLRKVSQIRTFDKINIFPSSGITAYISEQSDIREFPEQRIWRK